MRRWAAAHPSPRLAGTGHGYSVLDMAKAMETVSGRKVPYEIAPRRDGDLAAVYADPSKVRMAWRGAAGTRHT